MRPREHDRDAARRAAPVARAAVRETALVAGAVVAYFGVRNLTAGNAGAAFANADRLLRLERALGIAWEGGLQTALLGVRGVMTAANWVYIWGHWPVILAAAAGLYAFRRDGYYLLRNALFVSGAIGFLLFALFPVAPPRLLDVGLVDTVTEHSNAYRALQPPGLTNQYAAFPSLHAGWNLLVGIVLFRCSSRLALRALAVAGPAAMCAAVVITANHFVIDVVAGVAVVLVALAAAEAVERGRAHTLEAREREPDRNHRAAVRGRAPGREPARPRRRRHTGGRPVRRG